MRVGRQDKHMRLEMRSEDSRLRYIDKMEHVTRIGAHMYMTCTTCARACELALAHVANTSWTWTAAKGSSRVQV